MNKSIAEIYADRSGSDVETVLSMMKAEKWLTPDEAVSAGLADEVWGRDAPEAEEDGGNVIVNGIYHHLRGIPAPRMVFMHRETANKPTGGKDMDLKELKEKYPELVQQIRDEALKDAEAVADYVLFTEEDKDAAVSNALAADRARMKAIDEIAVMVGDEALVSKAKYDEPITAEQLAFVAMQKQAKTKQEFIQTRAAEVAPAAAIVPTPVDGAEVESKADAIADAKAAAKAYVASKGGKA